MRGRKGLAGGLLGLPFVFRSLLVRQKNTLELVFVDDFSLRA
jgi:predicted DNA-binding protein YlxM (UPF0122 family)